MVSTLGTPGFGQTMAATGGLADDDVINITQTIDLTKSKTEVLSILNKEQQKKYNYREDKILAELTAYIEKTYGQHYAAKDIQTIDVWESLGIEKESCQSNVMKYAMRYGKKGGYNKDDLLKILHYTILWWHFTQPKE